MAGSSLGCGEGISRGFDLYVPGPGQGRTELSERIIIESEKGHYRIRLRLFSLKVSLFCRFNDV